MAVPAAVRFFWKMIEKFVNNAPLDPLSWPEKVKFYYRILKEHKQQRKDAEAVKTEPRSVAPTPLADNVAVEEESLWPIAAMVCVAAGMSVASHYDEAATPAAVAAHRLRLAGPTGLRQALAPVAAAPRLRLAGPTGLRGALAPVAAAAAADASDRAATHAAAAAAAVGAVSFLLYARTGQFASLPPPPSTPHSIPVFGFILVIALALVPLPPSAKD